MAGDDMTFSGSFVFAGDQSTDMGVASLVIDMDKVTLCGMAISGWKSVGTVKTATKIDEGWICSIDEQPALDMYLRYLGKRMTPEDEQRWGKLILNDMGFFYPFHVEGAGDPVIRTPVKVSKEKNAIQLDYPIAEGTKFQFCMPPDFEVVEDVLQRAREMKQSSQTNAEALLIFSCAGRLTTLGPMTRAENDGLHEIWHAPMAGFFSYGIWTLTRRQTPVSLNNLLLGGTH
jgi:hypothetical protein